jgi:putative transcriptional regulator
MGDVVKDLASVAPVLLLSMPQLEDPNFRRTVVLLCQHSAEGAWGLVLNRPAGQNAAAVVQMDPPVAGDSDLEIWIGGPVEPQRGCILLGDDPSDEDAVRLAPGLFVSGSPVLLRNMLALARPRRVKLLMGYAGWGPGQLEEELTQSSWLLGDLELDLVFDVEPAMMWETAIRRLGADPSTLQMSSGVH